MHNTEQYEVTQWRVVTYAPGTFVPETRSSDIDEPSVNKAIKIAMGTKERYGAVPFCFLFMLHARKHGELDSKEVWTSPRHYLGGKVMTLADVKREMPNEHRLIQNMEGNGFKAVHQTTKGWSWTSEFRDNDIHLTEEMIAKALETA